MGITYQILNLATIWPSLYGTQGTHLCLPSNIVAIWVHLGVLRNISGDF